MGDYQNRGAAGKQSYDVPQQQQQHQQQQHPLDPKTAAVKEFVNYRFSEEEMRVIRECEVEAMYQRCMPLGLGLGLVAFYGVQKRYLKANKRFGAIPKIAGFALFGYIAGRLSYQGKCQEKMMKLPNSKFAEMLRNNIRNKSGCGAYRGDWGSTYGSSSGGIYDSIVPDPGVTTALSLAPFRSATDSYSDEYGQPDALNLDTNRPSYNNADETYNPTMEGKNDLDEELNIPTRKSSITYEELRQRNRDEFAKKQYRPYSSPAPPTPATAPVPSASTQQLPPEYDRRRRFGKEHGENETSQSTGPKNKYGDAWS